MQGGWGTSAGWEQWPRAFPADSEVSTSVKTKKKKKKEVQVVKRWESWNTELNTAQENLVGAAELNRQIHRLGKQSQSQVMSCFAQMLKFGFHLAGTF